MTLTPGAYLKLRRTARGLTVDDVAARFATEPRTAEHARAEWVELIEADAAPATFATIVALRRIYRFDMSILIQLEAIAQGQPQRPPRLCRICACSEHDACIIGSDIETCSWVADDLCSACQS